MPINIPSFTYVSSSTCRQGGEFDEALDAVHGLLSVNCDNTHRTPAEQAALQNPCGGSSPSNSSNSVCENNQNNTNLWEVRD